MDMIIVSVSLFFAIAGYYTGKIASNAQHAHELFELRMDNTLFNIARRTTNQNEVRLEGITTEIRNIAARNARNAQITRENKKPCLLNSWEDHLDSIT